jgi:hypothetical protein
MATQRIVICPSYYLCVVVKEHSDSKPFEAFGPRTDLASANFFQRVVGVTGVEPVTLRLSSACSNQLSYTPGRPNRNFKAQI